MKKEQGAINKQRVFVFAALVLLVVIILFLIWWWFIPSSIQPTTTPDTTPTSNVTVVLPPQKQVLEVIPQPVPEPRPGEAEVMTLARNFTERYGSWSTDSSYQNLQDLLPDVTGSLKQEFLKTISDSTPQASFKGSEARVLNIKIRSLTDSSADVLVTAQRIETDNLLQENVVYEELALEMVKPGEFWLVDEALWQ